MNSTPFGMSKWRVAFTKHDNLLVNDHTLKFHELLYDSSTCCAQKIFCSTFKPFDIKYIDEHFPLVPLTLFISEDNNRPDLTKNACATCGRKLCTEKYVAAKAKNEQDVEQDLYWYCTNETTEDYLMCVDCSEDYLLCFDCYSKVKEGLVLPHAKEHVMWPMSCRIMDDVHLQISTNTDEKDDYLSKKFLSAKSSWCSIHRNRMPYHVCGNCFAVLSEKDFYAERIESNDISSDGEKKNVIDQSGAFKDMSKIRLVFVDSSDEESDEESDDEIDLVCRKCLQDMDSKEFKSLTSCLCECSPDLQRKISWLFPRIPDTFCVHPKIALIQFPSYLRVIISSFNVSEQQEILAGDMYWWVDVLRKNHDVGCSSKFECDLIELIDAMGSTEWAGLISLYDFSLVDQDDIHLVTSIPGTFTVKTYGMDRLNSILKDMPPFSSENKVDIQVWSMGGSNLLWYSKFLSILTQNRNEHNNFDIVRFIFENGNMFDSRCITRNSLYYDANNPLFCLKRCRENETQSQQCNVAKDALVYFRILNKMLSSSLFDDFIGLLQFCKIPPTSVGEDGTPIYRNPQMILREHFHSMIGHVPDWSWHSKVMSRTYGKKLCSWRCDKLHGWRYIGSHNFSAASWGSYYASDQLSIRNWEVGIVIRSALCSLNKHNCGVDLTYVPNPFDPDSLHQYPPDNLISRHFKCIEEMGLVTKRRTDYFFEVTLIKKRPVNRSEQATSTERKNAEYDIQHESDKLKLSIDVLRNSKPHHESCWNSNDMIGCCVRFDLSDEYGIVWVREIFMRNFKIEKAQFIVNSANGASAFFESVCPSINRVNQQRTRLSKYSESRLNRDRSDNKK